MHAHDPASHVGPADKGQELVIGQKLAFAAASLTLGVMTLPVIITSTVIAAIAASTTPMRSASRRLRPRRGLVFELSAFIISRLL